MFGWFKRNKPQACPMVQKCRALFADGGRLLDENPPKELSDALALAALHIGYISTREDTGSLVTKFISTNTNRDMLMLDRAIWALMAYKHYLVKTKGEDHFNVGEMIFKACQFLAALYYTEHDKERVMSFVKSLACLYGTEAAWFKVPMPELLDKAMLSYIGKSSFSDTRQQVSPLSYGLEYVAIYNSTFSASMLQIAVEGLDDVRNGFRP